MSLRVSIRKTQPRARSAWGEQPPAEPATGKKTQIKEVPSPQADWQEGAGSLLSTSRRPSNGPPHGASNSPLAKPPHRSSSVASYAPPTRNAAKPIVDAALVFKPWDCGEPGMRQSYTGQALALLTSRQIAYGYRHIERFLAELAQVGADKSLTQALASWTASLWKRPPGEAESPVPVFYVDGHRKAVYADHLIPRGLVGRLQKVLGCRAPVVLHDQEGHPLLVTTHRGDQHLTSGLPAILTSYEQVADQKSRRTNSRRPRGDGS